MFRNEADRRDFGRRSRDWPSLRFSRRNVGIIGTGRSGRTHDMSGILKHDKIARIAAVCDVDANRLAEGKQLVEDQYKKQANGYLSRDQRWPYQI